MTRSRLQRCSERGGTAWAVALAVALCAAAPVSARAQRGGDAVATYEAHVRAGTELFQAEDFATARSEFEAAYAIHPEPTLLFNIASTYRREGDASAAVESYRRFLAAAPADHPNRELAEATVAELEAELRAEPDSEDGFLGDDEPGDGDTGELEPAQVAARAESDAAASPLVRAQPQRDGNDPGRNLRIAGAVTISAGAVGLIAAAVDLRRAAEFSAQLEDTPQGAWTPELQDYYDRGQRAETRAVVVGGLGLAAAATGAVLYWLGERAADDEGVDLAVSAGAGSAQVGLSGRF